MNASLFWYFVIGNLLANGMPHFIWGRSKVVARSPFGQYSSPALNVRWGLANFVAATVLALWRVWKGNPTRPSLIALLFGYWLTVGMFGISIKHFVSG